ncbi:four-carbon acid sugar kinase family protein [Candidatus Latescibacterota bacterium]
MLKTLKTKLAVIADDFTGSSDTGVQFSKKGFSTGLIVYPPGSQASLSEFDILAVDTESRADPKETAYEKVFDAARILRTNGIPHVYKKFDSTMRGNIGAELEAALRGYGATAVVAAPAFPDNGRITMDGICSVHGVPLANTEFAANPVTPVTSSYIPDIIGAQTSLKTGTLGLGDIREGIDAAVRELRSLIEHGAEIIVADAEHDRDLAVTASALSVLDLPVISAGSSAFASYIADSLGISAEIPKRKPILVVAGSVTETTRAQIEFALAKGYFQQIDIDVRAVLEGDEDAVIGRIVGEFSKPGTITSHMLIRTAPSVEDVAEAFELGAQLGIDNSETERRIASFLGKLVREIYGALGFHGMILTGGDTAFGVTRSLGATGTVIREEVLPGIPKCTFRGTVFGDIPVITKAGGFGDEDAIARMIEFLERTLSVF